MSILLPNFSQNDLFNLKSNTAEYIYWDYDNINDVYNLTYKDCIICALWYDKEDECYYANFVFEDLEHTWCIEDCLDIMDAMAIAELNIQEYCNDFMVKTSLLMYAFKDLGK